MCLFGNIGNDRSYFSGRWTIDPANDGELQKHRRGDSSRAIHKGAQEFSRGRREMDEGHVKLLHDRLDSHRDLCFCRGFHCPRRQQQPRNSHLLVEHAVPRLRYIRRLGFILLGHVSLDVFLDPHCPLCRRRFLQVSAQKARDRPRRSLPLHSNDDNCFRRNALYHAQRKDYMDFCSHHSSCFFPSEHLCHVAIPFVYPTVSINLRKQHL